MKPSTSEEPMLRLLLTVAVALSLAAGVMPNGQAAEKAINEMVSGDIYFGVKSAELTAEAKKTTDELYVWVRDHPGSTVLLAGYDDQRTPEKESVELGWKRAEAVRDRLISLGVAPNSVHAISFGNTKTAASGEGEAVWSKNRRVRYRIAPPPGSEKTEGMPGGVCQRCKK